MKEVIKYIAEDGKEFYDETECLRYETKNVLNEKFPHIHLFDDCSKKTGILEDIYYIVIVNGCTEQELKEFKAYMKWETGCDSSLHGLRPVVSTWEYNYEKKIFIDLSKKYYDIENTINELWKQI